MNVEKLYEGQVFKNYKEMCEVLELIPVTSNSKLAQFKELERYYEVKKQGHKIYIGNKYSQPLDKIETRGNRNGTGVTLLTPLVETNPLLAKQWNASKNGELTNNITRCTLEEYYWDCDCCNKTIFTSPQKRLTPAKGFTDEAITCPYCVLSKQAKRVYNLLEINNIRFTQEYTFDDLIGTGNVKRRLRFDFAIFNTDNTLKCLIEYDGQYHDTIKSTQTHDTMKDEYCKNNNIPLLRIHHTDKDSIEMKINEFLGLITDSELNKVNELRKVNEDLHTQIEALMNQIQHNTIVIQSILNK